MPIWLSVSRSAMIMVMLIEPAWQNPIITDINLCWEVLLNLKINLEIKYPSPNPKKIQTTLTSLLTISRKQNRDPRLPVGYWKSRDQFAEYETGH